MTIGYMKQVGFLGMPDTIQICRHLPCRVLFVLTVGIGVVVHLSHGFECNHEIK